MTVEQNRQNAPSFPSQHFALLLFFSLLLVLIVAPLGDYAVRLYTEKNGSVRDGYLFIQTVPLGTLKAHEHTLKDSLTDHAHAVYATSTEFVFWQDTVLTSMELVMNGAPKSTLHHLVLFNLSKPNTECANYPGEPLISISLDTPPNFTLPPPYGMFFPRGSRLMLYAMFHNPRDEDGSGIDYDSVSVALKLGVEESEKTTRTRKVSEYRLLRLEDTPYCQALEVAGVFEVPPKSTVYTKSSDVILGGGANPSEMIFKEDGEIITMAGHMHPWEGGKHIDTYINDEFLVRFTPVETGRKGAEWLTPPRLESVIPVEKGDRLTFSATYENPHELPVRGAMGMLGVYFSPYKNEVEKKEAPLEITPMQNFWMPFVTGLFPQ